MNRSSVRNNPTPMAPARKAELDLAQGTEVRRDLDQPSVAGSRLLPGKGRQGFAGGGFACRSGPRTSRPAVVRVEGDLAGRSVERDPACGAQQPRVDIVAEDGRNAVRSGHDGCMGRGGAAGAKKSRDPRHRGFGEVQGVDLLGNHYGARRARRRGWFRSAREASARRFGLCHGCLRPGPEGRRSLTCSKRFASSSPASRAAPTASRPRSIRASVAPDNSPSRATSINASMISASCGLYWPMDRVPTRPAIVHSTAAL